MKILEPGHAYQPACYDGDDCPPLIFMQRVGPGYPGNGHAHPGTNCQEVLRALIDRVIYLDSQVPCVENGHILANLRGALKEFEVRAALRHGLPLPVFTEPVEDMPTCGVCGHVTCEHVVPTRVAQGQGT